MPRFLMVVHTNPVDGADDEYNDWYENAHLDDVLKVPGITSAQRFRLADGGADAAYRYLALYMVEADNVGAVSDELKSRAGTADMPISPALDPGATIVFYDEIGPPHTA
ncbi:MAG: hypothetical protein ABW122_14335 [Ilumatobacteraceae bacterium]